MPPSIPSPALGSSPGLSKASNGNSSREEQEATNDASAPQQSSATSLERRIQQPPNGGGDKTDSNQQPTGQQQQSSLLSSPLSGLYGGSGMYGGAGYYGNSFMFGGGSPYYGAGMMMGPLSGMNQFLFGVQNVIFSLGQAVQIVGMNTQALDHLVDAVTSMFDHAVATWHEMQALDAEARAFETEEQKKRRRRLRALRYAMLTAVTFAGYKLMKRIFASRRKQQRRYLEAAGGAPHRSYGPSPYGMGPSYASSFSPYSSGGYSQYKSPGAYGYY